MNFQMDRRKGLLIDTSHSQEIFMAVINQWFFPDPGNQHGCRHNIQVISQDKCLAFSLKSLKNRRTLNSA